MDPATAIEIGILATADATWKPHRRWSNFDATGAVYAARADFREHGVPWRSGGVTDAEVKARSRTIQELKAAGRVEVWQPRLKSLRVRLRPHAEAEARHRVRLGSLAGAVATMAEIARHCDRHPTRLDRLWVAETLLNNGKGWGYDATVEDRRGLLITEQLLAPALCLEWVESLACLRGHLCYRLTPAGWAVLDADDPQDFPEWGDPDHEAEAAYFTQLAAVLAGFEKPPVETTRDLGAIPLPCAYFGLRIGPHLSGVVGTGDAARRGR